MDDAPSADQDDYNQKTLIWWCATAMTLGFIAFLMILAWCIRYNGGYDWKNPRYIIGTFNFHATFQILAFVVIAGTSMISHRLLRTVNKLYVKILHATLNIIAFIFIIVGVTGVFWYHDAHGIPHLQSAHSWIGLTLLLLVSLQWVMGFFGLLWPGFRDPLRGGYEAAHRFTGRCIFILAMIEILIGINKVSSGHTIMNVLALLIILYAVIVGYILSNNSYTRQALYNGVGTGGYQPVSGTDTMFERKSSTGSFSRRTPTTVKNDDENTRYANVSSGAAGNYQSLNTDPSTKEALAVGRDTLNRFTERLEAKRNANLSGPPVTSEEVTTTITD